MTMKQNLENYEKRMKQIKEDEDKHVRILGIEIQALRSRIPKQKIYFGKVKIE